MADSAADRMIPLLGFMEGDTLGLLVFARPNETIAELALKLRQATRLRTTFEGVFYVERGGRTLALESTVAFAGLSALDRFDVRFRRKELAE